MAMVLAGQSIAVLWGPPGTGKTYTLAHLAASLVRSGKRVLLLAPTRVAADTATLAIDSALEPERRPGLVLRTDLPDLYEAFATRGKHLLTWANADSRYHTIAAGFLRKKQQLLGRRSSAPESERPRLDHELAELRTQHEAAREAYKEEQAQLVAHAMVVCATIRQNQAKGWHKSFDQVLVDEASMMSVSDAMHLLVSSTTPTIFAGDHKQLGPISQAAGRGRETPTIAQPVAATWLGTSILELLDQRLSALRVQRVLLNEQSRMNPELCQVVSTTMYEGELVALNAPKPGLPPHLPAGICVLDSERPPRWLPAAPDLGRPSHLALATPQSAAAAVALARLLARSGHSVVLAAPFRAQAALLRRGVDDLGTIVRAGTVHRLQGQEADVAIYDPTKPHHPWPDQSREAPLMLNVAASRGRRAFVLCNGMTWLMRSTLLRPFLVAARVL
ncbi:MAG: AAA family ATPase [Planctomycetes bacterium]|nr:AAA family ATPase [Planctomycetota bacterium]